MTHLGLYTFHPTLSSVGLKVLVNQGERFQPRNTAIVNWIVSYSVLLSANSWIRMSKDQQERKGDAILAKVTDAYKRATFTQ